MATHILTVIFLIVFTAGHGEVSEAVRRRTRRGGSSEGGTAVEIMQVINQQRVTLSRKYYRRERVTNIISATYTHDIANVFIINEISKTWRLGLECKYMFAGPKLMGIKDTDVVNICPNPIQIGSGLLF